MPLPSLTILRQYAQTPNPSTLPSSVLLTHTPTSLTIFDAYPKSTFHFLLLPRLTATPPGLGVSELTNLRQLLKNDRDTAKTFLTALQDDSKKVEAMIQDEMQSRYGYRWPVQIGFHAVPSMEHLHVHILSSDLCSATLKNKKHYNSFHPKLGFFIHLDDVLSWFEADSDPSHLRTMAQLKLSKYEPLLKEDLGCWRCGRELKNMTELKKHLESEMESEKDREFKRLERKRNLLARSRNGKADSKRLEGEKAEM